MKQFWFPLLLCIGGVMLWRVSVLTATYDPTRAVVGSAEVRMMPREQSAETVPQLITNNITINYTYDAAGRLTKATYGNPSISYTYDNNGNRLTRTDSTQHLVFVPIVLRD